MGATRRTEEAFFEILAKTSAWDFLKSGFAGRRFHQKAAIYAGLRQLSKGGFQKP